MTKSNLFLVAGVLACGSVQALTLSSPAFEEGATIPDVFTFNLGGQCNGANQSPPLVFSQVPQGTRSLALTMVDPDGGNWLHWKVWNLGGSVTALAPNASASQALEQGRSDFGAQGYGGPCPPTPNHRYVFTLYALNKTFSTEPNAAQLQAAALATATLTGKRSPGDRLAWVAPDRLSCLFNWVERQVPEFVAPRGSANLQGSGFTYRYYAQTNSYLGATTSPDPHVYFLNEAMGLVDLGAASVWAQQAACP